MVRISDAHRSGTSLRPDTPVIAEEHQAGSTKTGRSPDMLINSTVSR
jgi:hypothetical protein